MVGGFQSVLCVSVYQGSLLVITVLTDRNNKSNYCEGSF